MKVTEKTAALLNNYILENRNEIVSDILTLVSAQSPSSNKEACDHCADVLADIIKNRLGIDAYFHDQPKYGKHVSASTGTGHRTATMIGHYDTVWNIDALPLVVGEEKISGPGIFDMKTGDIISIWAVKALKEFDLIGDRNFEFFFNGDEEVGSPSSNPAYTPIVLDSDCALVLEAPDGPNLKIGRKGIGMFDINITGLAAHAGLNHDLGRSAIWEAAKIIDYVQSLTDYKLGTTLNVGIVSGGSKRNVVPASASLQIDLRIATKDEGKRIYDLIYAIKPHFDGVKVEVSGALGQPPMENTPGNQALFKHFEETTALLGGKVGGIFVGSASDGNYTSSLGVPTLDGLGAVGEGAHAAHEHILVTPSLDRISRLAVFLCDL